MPSNKTGRSKGLVATILLAVVILASPILINATDSSAVDPINCTPCLSNPPSPPPSSCTPPPPPPSPPPPLPSPPPPPPSPSPPPPSQPPPKESYCPPPPLPPPPPPPPAYVLASPPGDIYPIDHEFGAAAAGENFKVLKLIVFGMIGFMIL